MPRRGYPPDIILKTRLITQLNFLPASVLGYTEKFGNPCLRVVYYTVKGKGYRIQTRRVDIL